MRNLGVTCEEAIGQTCGDAGAQAQEREEQGQESPPALPWQRPPSSCGPLIQCPVVVIVILIEGGHGRLGRMPKSFALRSAISLTTAAMMTKMTMTMLLPPLAYNDRSGWSKGGNDSNNEHGRRQRGEGGRREQQTKTTRMMQCGQAYCGRREVGGRLGVDPSQRQPASALSSVFFFFSFF